MESQPTTGRGRMRHDSGTIIKQMPMKEPQRIGWSLWLTGNERMGKKGGNKILLSGLRSTINMEL